MLHVFRNLGIALVGTALVFMLTLTPAAAWGGYGGGGNSYGSSGGYGSYHMPTYSSNYGYQNSCRYCSNYGYHSNYGHPSYSRNVLYWVHFGDTLTRIAARFHTSVGAILAANPRIQDPDVIFAGMKLWVPVGSRYSTSYGGSSYGSSYGSGYSSSYGSGY